MVPGVRVEVFKYWGELLEGPFGDARIPGVVGFEGATAGAVVGRVLSPSGFGGSTVLPLITSISASHLWTHSLGPDHPDLATR